MLRKSTMTALTALAVLGLAVSSASAKPGGPGFGPKGPGMGNPGIVKPAGGIKIIPSNPKIAGKPNLPVKPIFVPHWPHKHPHWHVHYRPRIWYPPVVVGGPTYIASRPVASAPGPCTCLSKEYTPEGAVLFKDRCTNEMAMNPPAQQTGAAEPQQQTAQYQQQYVQPQPQAK
jgi:hypothetical protein